jgi:aspartyl-tRNA(Asn)/glutamyl-tRNA(Gln) amidotransferase subunit B
MTETYRIKGNTGLWEVVIGLEIHAQVTSNSKLFSGASTSFGDEPNHNVAFLDAGMPGMLPVLNREAVAQAVRTGFGLNAIINKRSVFDRKNYFYADLPLGYQISQFFHPIVGEGQVNILLKDGSEKIIGIERIHLEQDAGKSLHDQSPNETFVDFNRAGVALMEIVSRPDLRSPEEAAEYVKKIRAIMRYLGTCDGDMEKGSMRCDVNVSVRKEGETKLGTRCEIKNVNSIRFLQKAVEYEASRQVELLEDGKIVAQETRLFDATTGTTRTMRSKEDAHDYRYFPDPDLLPLVLTDEFIAEIKNNLPELPDAKQKRYTQKMGLSAYDASVIAADKETAAFFETLAEKNDAKLASNWLTVELFGRLNKREISIENSPVSAQALSELLDLIRDETISGKIAKEVLDEMMESGQSASKIVTEKGLQQVTDSSEIEKTIDEVIKANADKLAEYRSGKDKLFGFFVGQVMKLSGGKANPALVNDLLKQKLAG